MSYHSAELDRWEDRAIRICGGPRGICDITAQQQTPLRRASLGPGWVEASRVMFAVGSLIIINPITQRGPAGVRENWGSIFDYDPPRLKRDHFTALLQGYVRQIVCEDSD